MKIITTHTNVDFDAFASMAAATLIYPDATAAIPKNVNPNVRAFISMHKDLFDYMDRHEVPIDRVRELVVVDTDDWKRLGPLSRLRDRRDLKVFVWDHHRPGTIRGTWKCQERKGATITLLIDRLKDMEKSISPIQATLFLTGLYEDTGNLSFPSVTPEDAYAAGWLLDQKADLSLINKFLRPAYGQKQKDILFEMLKNSKRQKINGYSVSLSRISVEGHVSNLALVVRMYRDIVNVDVAFGMFVSQEKKGKTKCIVIGRSDNDSLDVGTLMKSLGGGGHPGAGSAMLKGVNPDVAQEMIYDLIAGNQQSSVQVSDIMSFPVFSVSSETTMSEAARELRERECTGLPVVDDGTLVGIISRRDFKKIRREDQLDAPVKAFMSTLVHTIAPGRSPLQAARLMIRHDIGRLPVVSSDGQIIGILTRSDAMVYFYDLLPD